ncbi:DUF3307 domain-containing protein [Flavobacterium sp.]|uniref:DUF3307 domain-containing protein n=1 Tax=Flavobacterium sp. TaxID=239 RepID=UPI003528BF44
MILFVKLFLAHILGDFFWQPSKWVKHKEKHIAKSKFLYWHTLLHFALIWLILFELSAWKIALPIAFLHGVIDYLKLRFQTKKTKRKLFIYDQILHLFVIIFASYFFTEYSNYTTLNLKNNIVLNQLLLYGTAILFVTKPSSIIIKNIISIWAPENEKKKDKNSLQNAGNYIGILERLFVLFFVIIGNFSAIGFILAAKSIFRFGDLTAAKDRKLTEYVLIGTLLSFAFAFTTGIITDFLNSFLIK